MVRPLRLSDMLSAVDAAAPSDLSSLQVSQQAAKCIPAMVCPELTEQIRREVAASLHQRKGDFTCYFLTDLVTFTLPAGQFVNIAAETQPFPPSLEHNTGVLLVSSCSNMVKNQILVILLLFTLQKLWLCSSLLVARLS